VGHRIWLVSGLKKSGSYSLVATFIVNKVGHRCRGEWKNWASSSHEQTFMPPIRRRLANSRSMPTACNNYSLDCRPMLRQPWPASGNQHSTRDRTG